MFSLYYLSRGLAIGNQELNTESLLAVQIKDDEIFELLERLAATEEMFKAPVSTIGDVAELTDASPSLIARILADMRGPDEFERLHSQVQTHDNRLDLVEQKLSNLGARRPFGEDEIAFRRAETDRMVKEWTNRPRKTSANVKLSEWEVSGDDKSFYTKKKVGLRASDIFFLALFAVVMVLIFLIMRGDVHWPGPNLPPPYETR